MELLLPPGAGPEGQEIEAPILPQSPCVPALECPLPPGGTCFKALNQRLSTHWPWPAEGSLPSLRALIVDRRRTSRAGGLDRTSDQHNEIAVARQHRVGSHELERLGNSLRDQQPIEGVGVVQRQSGHSGGV